MPDRSGPGALAETSSVISGPTAVLGLAILLLIVIVRRRRVILCKAGRRVSHAPRLLKVFHFISTNIAISDCDPSVKQTRSAEIERGVLTSAH